MGCTSKYTTKGWRGQKPISAPRVSRGAQPIPTEKRAFMLDVNGWNQLRSKTCQRLPYVDSGLAKWWSYFYVVVYSCLCWWYMFTHGFSNAFGRQVDGESVGCGAAAHGCWPGAGIFSFWYHWTAARTLQKLWFVAVAGYFGCASQLLLGYNPTQKQVSGVITWYNILWLWWTNPQNTNIPAWFTCRISFPSDVWWAQRLPSFTEQPQRFFSPGGIWKAWKSKIDFLRGRKEHLSVGWW